MGALSDRSVRDSVPLVRVLIVVASQTGRTARMAEAVAEGAREGGAEVLVRNAEEARNEDLLDAQAVILGSGVHMGGNSKLIGIIA